jgi:hypothetical protein
MFVKPFGVRVSCRFSRTPTSSTASRRSAGRARRPTGDLGERFVSASQNRVLCRSARWSRLKRGTGTHRCRVVPRDPPKPERRGDQARTQDQRSLRRLFCEDLRLLAGGEVVACPLRARTLSGLRASSRSDGARRIAAGRTFGTSSRGCQETWPYRKGVLRI